MIFLDTTPKTYGNKKKKKNNKLDFTIKKFCASRDTINKETTHRIGDICKSYYLIRN